MEKSLNRIIGASFLLISALLYFFSSYNFAIQWQLLLISICFLFLYIISGRIFRNENIYFLLTALILASTALLFTLKPLDISTHIGSYLISLGLSFLLTYFIHYSFIGTAHPNNSLWLVYAGSMLLVIGFTSFIYFTIWVFIFLLLGILLLIRSFKL